MSPTVLNAKHRKNTRQINEFSTDGVDDGDPKWAPNSPPGADESGILPSQRAPESDGARGWADGWVDELAGEWTVADEASGERPMLDETLASAGVTPFSAESTLPLARPLRAWSPEGTTSSGREAESVTAPWADSAPRSDNAAEDEADVLLIEAREQELRGNAKEAMRLYDAALAKHAECIEALRGMERTARTQGRVAQVARVLERLVEIETGDHRVASLCRLAELHENHFVKPQRAASYLEEALRLAPNHEAAGEQLERCYRAMHAWPELARLWTLRASTITDTRLRFHKLACAADLIETQLGDHAWALATYRDMLRLSPSHGETLSALVRLSDKTGDAEGAVYFRRQLAEVTRDVHKASELHAQVGAVLESQGKLADALAHFERAIELDPTSGQGWDGLERVARAQGERGLLAHCLERRAAFVESARVRAGLLVRLGAVRAELGQRQGAMAAYEEALALDAHNEQAARFVFDVYMEEEAWSLAGPLCETLLTAAHVRSDADRWFELHQAATRIAFSRGDARRALAAAHAALGARPADPDAREDFIIACHLLRQDPVIRTVGEALELLIEQKDVLTADQLARLGDIQASVGDLGGSADSYARCLALAPSHRVALKGAADVHVLSSDYDAAAKLHLQLAELSSDAARFDHFVEAGELWARKANDLASAAPAYEAALAVRPNDHWLLHTLLWLYTETKAWEKVASTLGQIATIQETPERKAKSLFAEAQVREHKLQDLAGAAKVYDAALREDRTRLEAFESIVRVLTASKDWGALVEAYCTMIARTEDTKLLGALYKQLALIYRDRVRDHGSALEVFRRATALNPQDKECPRALIELLAMEGRLDETLTEIRAAIQREPNDPTWYQALYEVALRQRAFDRAWCAVDALSHVSSLEKKSLQFHREFSPPPLASVPGMLTHRAWRTHLLHPGLDPLLTALLAVATRGFTRLRSATLPPREALSSAHSNEAHRLLDALQHACDVLGTKLPHVWRGTGSSGHAIVPELGEEPALVVAPSLLQLSSPGVMRFMLGKRLADLQPELAPRTAFSSMSQMGELVASAIRVARGDHATDAQAGAFDQKLREALHYEEQEILRMVVEQRAQSGEPFDLKRWCILADASSNRAGLLLGGHLADAKRGLQEMPQAPSEPSTAERMALLAPFAVSEEYAELRAAIGIALVDDLA